jgi:hypothetical protein
MKYGFTGSSTSTTLPQQVAFTGWIDAHRFDVGELHHGDCIEADEFAHQIVREFTAARIIIHQPESDAKRAFCGGDEYLDPLPYLDRNKEIVKACDTLLAMPHGEEELRSGTWSTIRAARRLGKPIVVFWPDGMITTDPIGNSHVTPAPHSSSVTML